MFIAFLVLASLCLILFFIAIAVNIADAQTEPVYSSIRRSNLHVDPNIELGYEFDSEKEMI